MKGCHTHNLLDKFFIEIDAVLEANENGVAITSCK